jgi:putative peptidoglycan lipid II flippase
MTNLFSRANRQTTVGSAALLISGSYLVSRVLGLVRDRLIASHFGTGADVSAYVAAFRLPELLFTLLVTGAFAVAFIPVLSEHLVKEERDEAWELTSTILNLLVIGSIVVAALLYLFVNPLTYLVAPGFNAEQHHLTVNLTKIMLLTPVMFAISSVLGSVQQALHRFVVFALASAFYNVGIIFGILFLAPNRGIYGVAIGVVIGAGLQAALQILGLLGLGFRYDFKINLRLRNARRVLVLMVPRSIDQGMDQINYLVETIIGSRVGPDALAQYYFANNLKNVPTGLIASAITTATFPRLAATAAKGERQQLFREFAGIFRLILFLTLPSALTAIVLRGYIVRLLFGFGDSTTASTLGWFSGAIIFQSLFMLVARVYYAMQDTKTPLMTSIAAIALNAGLSFWLSGMFGVLGLAQAASLSAGFETLALLIILRKRYGRIGEGQIAKGLWAMMGTSAVLVVALYASVRWLLPLYATDRGILVVGPKFLALAIIGAAAYLIPSYLFRIKEARYFIGRLRDALARTQTLN